MYLAIVLLSLAVIFLSTYLLLLKRQQQNINRQLHKRLTRQTRQPITLELMDRDLNNLVININRCLKAEENLRLNSNHENNHFKELIANISHDLRTPLTAIKGYQQLIEREELNAAQTQKLQIAIKHTNALEELIEQFFEYSYLVNAHSQEDHEALVPEHINLTALLQECLADMYEHFEERGMSIHVLQKDTVYVRADPLMLIRIIQNLIRNSLVHSCGDLEVALLDGENTGFLFRNPLSDANIDINRIFDRFYSSDPSRTKTSGLGLAIVRMLTERLGGNVQAEISANIFEIRITLPHP